MREIRTYDEDFKRQAVELAISSEKSNKSIAKDLGIPESTLRGWIDSDKYKGISETEYKEIKRLKKELAEVRMERDILKKAVAVFSKQ